MREIEQIPDPCPICTTEQNAYFEHVVADQGVTGWDQTGREIGDAPAEKETSGVDLDNWHPLHSEKQIGCGEIRGFGSFDGPGSESDGNWFLRPNAKYQHLFYDALPHVLGWSGVVGEVGGAVAGDLASTLKECGGPPCIEAENDPDQAFQSTFFYNLSSKSTTLLKKDVCVYGPWVREYVHDNRMEIHPAELMWWKEPASGTVGDKWFVAIYQDDSDRFDARHHFDDPPATATGWRPWADAPRVNDIWLAFETDELGSEGLEFEISEVHAREITLNSTADLDESNDTWHDLRYKNRRILRVREAMPDDHVRVRFSNVCMTGGRIRGYMKLSTRIGSNSAGGEGFQVLQIAKLASPLNAPPPPDPSPLVSHPTSRPGTGVRAILQFSSMGGAAQTSPTVEYIMASANRQNPLRRAELVRNRQPVPVRVSQTQDGALRVAGVPVRDTGTLFLTYADGRRSQQAVEGFGLATFATRARPVLTSPDAAGAAMLSRASGIPADVRLPADRAVRAQRWEVEVIAEYAPRIRGAVMPEERDTIARVLNAALHGNSPQARMALLGADPSLRFEAMVYLRDGDGRLLDSARTGAIRQGPLQLTQTGPGRAMIMVQTPSGPTGVASTELLVRAVDRSGASRFTLVPLASHFISVDRPTATAIANGIAASTAAVGSPGRDLSVKEMPTVAGARTRQSEMLRTFASQAAKDSILSLSELRAMGGIVAKRSSR